MERFIELYKTVYRDLYYLAYYYLGSAEEAEDAVGEAVLKAYENFSSLRKEDAFRSWIFKILVNQCKKQLRKKSEKFSFLQLEETAYIQELTDEMVTQEIMSILSMEEKRIVALAVFGGYKGEDIARIMHLRHSTIRSKYRRALKKMEKELLKGGETV